MERHIEAFLEMLAAERGAARNTLAAYGADLIRFETHACAQGETVATASIATLRGYLQALTAARLSARTAARHLACLRQFYRFLCRENIRPDDPTQLLDSPRIPSTLPKCLSESEVDRLLQAARTRPGATGLLAQAAIEMLYATGLRISELLALPAHALVGDARLLVVRGKGGKDRAVPISERARQATNALLADRKVESRWLFAGRDPRQAMTRQGFALLLKDLAIAAGIDPTRVSPHVLRHAFASHMLAGGADLRSLQVLLGHADIATTEIYTHVLTEHLQALLESAHPLANRNF